MAQLIKDYNFGFPLQNVQQLDDIEQNILTDDKYATSLVNKINSSSSNYSIMTIFAMLNDELDI